MGLYILSPFYFLNIPLSNKNKMVKSSFRIRPSASGDLNYVEILFLCVLLKINFF